MFVISGRTAAMYEMYGGTVVVVGAGRVVVVVDGAVVVAGRFTCADFESPPPHALSASANTNNARKDRRTSFTASERSDPIDTRGFAGSVTSSLERLP